MARNQENQDVQGMEQPPATTKRPDTADFLPIGADDILIELVFLPIDPGSTLT